MRGPKPTPIVLTAAKRAVLERLARRESSCQQLVRRVRIVLEAAEGGNNEQVGERLGLYRATVRTWRGRWLEAASRLEAAEAAGERALAAAVEEVLCDEPRSGAPPTFTAEQVCQIVALSCEAPRESGREVTHWTPRELAEEAIKRGIVESISARSVGRFLG